MSRTLPLESNFRSGMFELIRTAALAVAIVASLHGPVTVVSLGNWQGGVSMIASHVN